MEPAAPPSDLDSLDAHDPRDRVGPVLDELRSDIQGMRSAFLELPAMDELDGAIGQLGRQLTALEDRLELRLSAIEAQVATTGSQGAGATEHWVVALTGSVAELHERVDRGFGVLEERLLVLEGAVVGLADRLAELREALWSRRRTPLRAGDTATSNGPAR